jgi:anti-sigma-K factor RskA
VRPHRVSQDDLVAYALGALEPREERTVAKHASGCESCTAELRRLAPAVGALAESVEPVDPPESLRQALMAAVHADASEPAAAEPAAPRGERVRGFLWRPAAVVGAAALVAAGAVGYGLRDEDESAETIEVTGQAPAAGSIVVEGNTATLHAHGMAPLAKGAVYQVWVAENGVVTPSAAFVPHSDGTATAAVPEVAEGATEVLVTEEPRAGRTAPSSDPILDARID